MALDPSPSEIVVRVESRQRWATVRSMHAVDGAEIRIKQFVYDWSDVSGIPTNVAHGWGNFYVPPVVFAVAGRPAFLGKDYKEHAAGFVSYWMVQVEASNFSSQETSPIRQVLESVRPAIGKDARALASRPLPLWSWIMRSGGRAWPNLSPTFARMRWFVDIEEAKTVPNLVKRVPTLDGYHFDSVGVTQSTTEEVPSTCWLFRTDDDHATLALWKETKVAKTSVYDHPKRESFPGFWEGIVDGIPLKHYFNAQSGFGLVFTEDEDTIYHTIHPTTLTPDPASDRRIAVGLFAALSSK